LEVTTRCSDAVPKRAGAAWIIREQLQNFRQDETGGRHV